MSAPHHKTAVFLEASVGLDPASPRTWSGIAPHLFPAMEAAGCLDRTFSLAVPAARKAMLMARTFGRDRQLWRSRYYASPGYRRAIDDLARRTGYDGRVAMQIGARFSLPDVFPDKRCFSFNDGNFVERLQSGFDVHTLPPSSIDRILRNEEEVAGKLSAICTFSEYLRQSFIRNYHVSPDRVFNVGGAVNLREIPPPAEGKNYANHQILFIGVEFERKGGPQLLKAFAALRETVPDAQLHLVGPRTLPSLPGGLPPGVMFHGHLSKSDPAGAATLSRLFAEASLFVMPSLYEPFGIAPVEAMMHEIPCLLTGEWALRELVTPGENGDLVEKGSVEDLTEKLRALLSDPTKLAAMGRRAREMVYPRYTWPAVVERLAAVIDRLAEGG